MSAWRTAEGEWEVALAHENFVNLLFWDFGLRMFCTFAEADLTKIEIKEV